MAACLAADLWWLHSAFIPLPNRDRPGQQQISEREKKTPIMEVGKKIFTDRERLSSLPPYRKALPLCNIHGLGVIWWRLPARAPLKLQRHVCHPHTSSNHLLQTIQINKPDSKMSVRNKIDEFHRYISYILIQTAPVVVPRSMTQEITLRT